MVDAKAGYAAAVSDPVSLGDCRACRQIGQKSQGDCRDESPLLGSNCLAVRLLPAASFICETWADTSLSNGVQDSGTG